MVRSSWGRAAAKSAVWKVIGVISLIVVSLAAGIDPVSIGKITIAYHVLTLILYVMHERFWNRVTWGRIEREENGIDNHRDQSC